MQSTENKAKHCWITSLFYPDRSGMNEMNKSMSMMRTEMEACKDISSANICKKLKKKKKCDSEEAQKNCKKTCDHCDDEEEQGNFFRDK